MEKEKQEAEDNLIQYTLELQTINSVITNCTYFIYRLYINYLQTNTSLFINK